MKPLMLEKIDGCCDIQPCIHVAFEGEDICQRFIGYNQATPGFCYLQWIDDPHPEHLKRVLVEAWKQVVDEQSGLNNKEE
jgi:hypothetical protein